MHIPLIFHPASDQRCIGNARYKLVAVPQLLEDTL
jgi:hypothetical protein